MALIDLIQLTGCERRQRRLSGFCCEPKIVRVGGQRRVCPGPDLGSMRPGYVFVAGVKECHYQVGILLGYRSILRCFD
jgi:hypothetical protein